MFFGQGSVLLFFGQGSVLLFFGQGSVLLFFGQGSIVGFFNEITSPSVQNESGETLSWWDRTPGTPLETAGENDDKVFLRESLSNVC